MNTLNQPTNSAHAANVLQDSTEAKRAEETRRSELAMLGIWIEKYPEQAREKLRKLALKISRGK